MRKKAQTNNEEMATAFHEAGHAFMYIHLGLKFEYVSISPNDKRSSLGHVKGKRTRSISNVSLNIMIKEVMILMSGLFAEEISGYASKAEMKNGAHGDFKSVALYVYNFMDEKELNLFIKWINHRIKEILNSNWQGVEKIATALLTKKKLSYNEVVSTLLDIKVA